MDISLFYYLQMLSVQTPSCAGMERLGIPARSTLGAPTSTRDDRYVYYDDVDESIVRLNIHLLSFRSHRRTFPTHHDLMISANRTNQSSGSSKSQQLSGNIKSHHNNNSNNLISCPVHIPLPDGESGKDKKLQLRNSLQVCNF